MTFEVEQKLRPELARDERLLWSGMPKQGLRFRPQDWFVVPFTLLWFGIVAFTVNQQHMRAGQPPVYLTTAGIPLIVIGVYLLVGRFFVDWYQRTRTYYGVTDQHVLIVDGLVTRKVRSLTLATLIEISLKERSDRSGSITFGPVSLINSWGFRVRTINGNNRLPPSFDIIEDAHKVYALIREAQRSDRPYANRNVSRTA